MRITHCCLVLTASFTLLCGAGAASPPLPEPAKQLVDAQTAGENRLRPDGWRPWQKGFQRDGELFVCDNGADAKAHRGAGQTLELNQSQPEPIVATAYSKAEGVTSSPDNDYAIYLDLVFVDGTNLWGQAAPFAVGTHDWQQRRVLVLPEKPVKSLSYYMLLRNHGGKAWFRRPELRIIQTPLTACTFDGQPVKPVAGVRGGFQLRDVAAKSDFLRVKGALPPPPGPAVFRATALGLTREKPAARVRFVRFDFKPEWGFRAALARYYELFPE